MRCRWLAVAILIALGTVPAIASDLMSDIGAARAAVEHQDWRGAVDPLTRLARQSPLNGERRLALARAHYYTGNYAAAANDYRLAYDLKAEDLAVAAYGVAKCEARLKQRADMLRWLTTANELGLRRLQDARSDDDFTAYREDPDYRKLVGLVNAAQMSRDEGWRTDIRFLADWVEKKSFHPFRSTTGDRILSNAAYTRDEFEADASKLGGDLPKLSDSEVELGLFRLVASVGDGHSVVMGSPTRPEFGMTMPLGFYAFDDGLYIVSASPTYGDLIGSKVLAVDGVEIDNVLLKIVPLIGRDNKEWLKASEPHYLRHTPFLKALGITHAEDAANLTLAAADESTKTARIASDLSEPDIWNALPKPAGWK